MPHLDPVALTQALVRVDTVNPPGHEDGCVALLADLLSAAGFDCRRHDFAPRRTSLVARLGRPPADGGRLPLAFTGHLDVVPLGGAPWRHDPFGGHVEDGRLYGRGSSDMKSGVAAIVCAAIGFAQRWRDAGGDSGGGVAGLNLVFTAGEETGCEGAFAMARHPEAATLLGRAGALVVAEPTGNAPLIGHKGALWLRATAAGITAHGSMPEQGDNAIYKVARAALALEAFAFDTPAHPLMGPPTLNVGTARGGLNINSVPDAAELGVDIRSVAGQDHAHVMRCLCAALGPHVGLETLLDVQSVYTPPEDPWLQRVFALCAARQGTLPMPRTVSYFTDAAALRLPMGIPPVLILGPGEAQQAHQTDEFCHVHRIHEAVTLFEDVIDDWCLAPRTARTPA